MAFLFYIDLQSQIPQGWQYIPNANPRTKMFIDIFQLDQSSKQDKEKAKLRKPMKPKTSDNASRLTATSATLLTISGILNRL